MIATMAFDQLHDPSRREDEIEMRRVPTDISNPLHRSSQVTSSRVPLVVRTTRVIETLMMKIVKERMPVNASFFLTSIDAFQRRCIDIRITGALSDFAFELRMRRIIITY